MLHGICSLQNVSHPRRHSFCWRVVSIHHETPTKNHPAMSSISKDRVFNHQLSASDANHTRTSSGPRSVQTTLKRRKGRLTNINQNSVASTRSSVQGSNRSELVLRGSSTLNDRQLEPPLTLPQSSSPPPCDIPSDDYGFEGNDVVHTYQPSAKHVLSADTADANNINAKRIRVCLSSVQHDQCWHGV